MKDHHSVRGTVLWTLVLLVAGGLTACEGERSDPASAERLVKGLWQYTGLTASDGQDLPLDGVFLFKDGTFVQQAVFAGQPFDEQGSMAHAGPYTAATDSVHLVAEQTISIAPGESSPLSFRASTEHDLDVTRSGEELTLVFGSGTVQEFEYLGPGEGEIHPLEDGALALVDGYFILVQGNESGSVSGYGTFERAGESLVLHVDRWAESDTAEASNHRDVVMQATFDGESLTLEDGRTFSVTQ